MKPPKARYNRADLLYVVLFLTLAVAGIASAIYHGQLVGELAPSYKRTGALIAYLTSMPVTVVSLCYAVTTLRKARNK